MRCDVTLEVNVRPPHRPPIGALLLEHYVVSTVKAHEGPPDRLDWKSSRRRLDGPRQVESQDLLQRDRGFP